MDVSVLIPARNEMFLARTVQDLLAHIEADTEIIVVLDGVPANPPLPDDPRVKVIWQPSSIGQRASTNVAARAATGKYIMKLDAHCAVDQGFDRKLIAPYESGEITMDTTTIPRMYNLHVFDWVCNQCGERTYQGPKPTGCAKCLSTEHTMDVVWRVRWNRCSDFMRFDNTLHFQYWSSYKHRPGAQQDIVDLMSSVGACWMMPRQRYWDLGGLDERHGSWGQMGTEIACKSWLSGGRQIVNKRTWFAHLFRTQPGFGFPYSLSNEQIDRARQHSRWLWFEGNWEKAVRPLSWLVNKFAPVPDWDASWGIVYYTDNRLDEKYLRACQKQLLKAADGHRIVSVSLKPLMFGDNITLPLERGYLTMFKQILAGIEASTTDLVYFAEHDVLYHPSHFKCATPPDNTFMYNHNVWKVNARTGHALFHFARQTSGLCGRRDLLLEHYRKRVEIVERDGFDYKMGFEPGTHRPPRGVDYTQAKDWLSEFPNVDIRHGVNLTPSRWSKEQFRNQKYTEGWQEAEEVPGWGQTGGRFDEFLSELEE